MQDRFVAALRTRRSMVALAFAVVVTLLSMSGGAAAILLFPVWLGVGWVIAWIWETIAERRAGPKPSPFAKQRGSTGSRTMLRKDQNAHFITDNRGFLFRQRIWFEATGCPPVRIPAEQFARLSQEQVSSPVLVATAGERHYWWWDDNFYWENEGYIALDVQALIHRSRRQKERSLQHAHALLAGEKTRRRDPIPEDVRRFVWQRDGGQCQECGAREMLQYDHIIPWSQGGADTAENLQLLCADCNRLKSDAI